MGQGLLRQRSWGGRWCATPPLFHRIRLFGSGWHSPWCLAARVSEVVVLLVRLAPLLRPSCRDLIFNLAHAYFWASAATPRHTTAPYYLLLLLALCHGPAKCLSVPFLPKVEGVESPASQWLIFIVIHWKVTGNVLVCPACKLKFTFKEGQHHNRVAASSKWRNEIGDAYVFPSLVVPCHRL